MCSRSWILFATMGTTEEGRKDWHTLPVTDKQRARIKWWASKLGVPVPRPATRGEASAIISDWQDANLELLAELEEEKELAEMEAFELGDTLYRIDEWRDLYGCRKVPAAKAKAVLQVVGFKRAGEDISKYLDRFFHELRLRSPELFTKRKSRSGRRRKSSGLVLLVIIVILLWAVFRHAW
jgi:hypothetical protein